MTWLNGITETNACYRAFRSYDTFEITRTLEFNKRVAVFIARNRIIHWCNGNPANSRPRNEPFRHIVRINTIQNAANVSGGGDLDALNEALARLRALPAYSLYDTQEVDDADRADAHHQGNDNPHGGNDSDDGDDRGPPPDGPNVAAGQNAGMQADNNANDRVYLEERPRRREARDAREKYSQRRRELRQRIEQQRQREKAYKSEIQRLKEARQRHERQE